MKFDEVPPHQAVLFADVGWGPAGLSGTAVPLRPHVAQPSLV